MKTMKTDVWLIPSQSMWKLPVVSCLIKFEISVQLPSCICDNTTGATPLATPCNLHLSWEFRETLLHSSFSDLRKETNWNRMGEASSELAAKLNHMWESTFAFHFRILENILFSNSNSNKILANVFFSSSNVNEGEAAPVQKGHGTNVYLEFTEFSRSSTFSVFNVVF